MTNIHFIAAGMPSHQSRCGAQNTFLNCNAWIYSNGTHHQLVCSAKYMSDMCGGIQMKCGEKAAHFTAAALPALTLHAACHHIMLAATSLAHANTQWLASCRKGVVAVEKASGKVGIVRDDSGGGAEGDCVQLQWADLSRGGWIKVGELREATADEKAAFEQQHQACHPTPRR